MVSLPHESAEELHFDAAVTKGQELANHLLRDGLAAARKRGRVALRCSRDEQAKNCQPSQMRTMQFMHK